MLDRPLSKVMRITAFAALSISTAVAASPSDMTCRQLIQSDGQIDRDMESWLDGFWAGALVITENGCGIDKVRTMEGVEVIGYCEPQRLIENRQRLSVAENLAEIKLKCQDLYGDDEQIGGVLANIIFGF